MTYEETRTNIQALIEESRKVGHPKLVPDHSIVAQQANTEALLLLGKIIEPITVRILELQEEDDV